MAESSELIMEEREDMMVSPKGGKPVQKLAHFIQPMLGYTDPTPEKPFVYLPTKPIISKVNFNGWRNPTEEWVSWVNRLHSSYHFVWRSAGIYDAVLSSRYRIAKNQDLFFDLAQMWCSETNTFVFSWGEATVSLEDVMVLGGYSVLGDSVSGSDAETEFALIEEKLMKAYEDISKGKSPKGCQSKWMRRFMEGRSEIEHEAFLSLWLSRFVSPTFPFDVICRRSFKIAIHLARGTPIALAPVVLASIYRDLSLLKSVMNSSSQVNETGQRGEVSDDLFVLTLWAPLYLVQVWAWERFPMFRPKPNEIKYGEPRLARWHGVNENDIGNVRPMLQSAGDSFEWRPYVKRVDNLPSLCFYREKEECILVGSGLGEDELALARFVRVCELVGMDSIEQYNPHRVAMQFGFDQDIPKHVAPPSLGFDIPNRERMQLALMSYTNPLTDQTLYIPSKFYEPKVTVRYLAWHRRGVLAPLATIPGVVRKRGSSKRYKRLPEVKKVKYTADNEADIPPGFSPKRAVDHDHDMQFGLLATSIGTYCADNEADNPPGFAPECILDHGDDMQFGFLTENIGSFFADNEADILPRFSPNHVDHGDDMQFGFLTENVGTYSADNQADIPPQFSPEHVVDHGDDMQFGFLTENVGNDSEFPPGVTPNPEQASGLDSRKDVNLPSERMPDSLQITAKQEHANHESIEDSMPLLDLISQNLDILDEIIPDGKRQAMTHGLGEPLLNIEPEVVSGHEPMIASPAKDDQSERISTLEAPVVQLERLPSENKP